MIIIYPDVAWPHLNLVPRSCSHPIAAFAVRLVLGWIRKWADGGGWGVGGMEKMGSANTGKKKSNKLCFYVCSVGSE